MTTIYQNTTTCIICGTQSDQSFIGSTTTMGYSDLDTRPAPMARENLPHEIQNCPSCGYVAPKISAKVVDIKTLKKIIDSASYKKQLTNSELPELANLYLCSAIINKETNELVEAFWHTLIAAWVCDDANKGMSAIYLRTAALLLTDKIKESGGNFTEPESEISIKVDLLRRTSLFLSAKELIEKEMGSIQDEIIKSILNFQKELIELKDIGCHSIGEAVDV